MVGIIGISPIIVKRELVHVIPIKKLYDCPRLDGLKIWTKNAWEPIIEVRREKTSQKIYRISNCYNWLYATEDCKLLLENNDTIQVSKVVEDTKLFQIRYPESRVYSLPIPKNIEPEPHKLISIEDVDDRRGKDIHDLTDYINCKNIEAAKQAFLNRRNNLQPNITLVWNFTELQQLMMLAEKVGFQPRIPTTSLPSWLRFKSSYEDIKYDCEYLNQDTIDFKTGAVVPLSNPYTHEDYIKDMRELYSGTYVKYPLFHEDSGLWDLFVYQRSQFDKPLKEWRKPIFDYNRHYIYQIRTPTGFYQAGVGKLVVKTENY
ncbi:MAG: hypothetical protein LUQ65_06515 [Candidatus Helarchaeota archaeon]|nr:hypothetical protein [Candidatus Helarchaeota archaeon]